MDFSHFSLFILKNYLLICYFYSLLYVLYFFTSTNLLSIHYNYRFCIFMGLLRVHMIGSLCLEVFLGFSFLCLFDHIQMCFFVLFYFALSSYILYYYYPVKAYSLNFFLSLKIDAFLIKYILIIIWDLVCKCSLDYFCIFVICIHTGNWSIIFFVGSLSGLISK